MRYGLASSATSYVAIEERAADARTTAPAELRKIPVALTSGWGGSVRARTMTLAGAPPLLPFAAPAPMMSAPMASAPMPGARPPARRAAPSGLARMRDAIVGSPSAKKSKGAARAEEGSTYDLEAADGGDRVFELLMTQKADGRFERSPTLDAWLGASRNARLESVIATHGESIACTALVIALLEAEARDRESEWRLAVDKARAWLAANGATVDVESIVRASAGG